VEFHPVVSFPFTQHPLHARIEYAATIYAKGDREQAAQEFQSAISESENFVSAFDADLSLGYFYLALVAQWKQEPRHALSYLLRSMIAQEKTSDQLHPEVIVRYSCMAEIAFTARYVHLAVACALRAAQMARLLFPVHPWVVEALAKVAELTTVVDPDAAMKHFHTALEVAAQINADKEIVAKIYHGMSNTSLQLRNGPKALEYAALAYAQSPTDAYLRPLTMLREQLK
jgi:tetratricopeptide (TPR) repeat protein